ncbi:MAG TPA: hypothetical protein VFI48_11480 [Hyphomicrobiaceae bacterium]|nr:hypothetical protein [Hyphomicrobiaceae bacterium]
MIIIFRAWTETSRFEFSGYGITPQAASRALRQKLQEHGTSYALPHEWWIGEFAGEDAVMFKIKIGDGFSTEEVAVKEKVTLA